MKTNRVKYYRIKKKLTQEEVARQLNISLRQFQNIESGKNATNIYTAIKLSKLLGTNVYSLFPKK